MAARRTVVVGGLLALALAASAVLLAGQPASRPGAGRAPARTPAVTLVFGRLLPPATCDPRHCFAPRDLRRLKEQAYFDTVFHMPNQGVGGVKAAPPMVLGRH
ncbi:MAG TPA: hypothetical protein VMW49_04660, partial [Candidatus Dormibacteraeota bacterium]|nr:hypothetical protein [Candidatus Dormibacteraeota bacterium]